MSRSKGSLPCPLNLYGREQKYLARVPRVQGTTLAAKEDGSQFSIPGKARASLCSNELYENDTL